MSWAINALVGIAVIYISVQNGLVPCGTSFLRPVHAEHKQGCFCPICCGTACSQGWTYYQGDQTCVKAFPNNELTWEKARQTCQGLGADLVKIRDQAKNNFVVGLFSGTKTWSTWIGVHNNARVGYDFKLVDGTAATYLPWISGDPIGRRDLGVKCVYLFLTNYKGKWGDWRCADKQPYTCSMPNV